MAGGRGETSVRSCFGSSAIICFRAGRSSSCTRESSCVECCHWRASSSYTRKSCGNNSRVDSNTPCIRSGNTNGGCVAQGCNYSTNKTITFPRSGFVVGASSTRSNLHSADD